MSVHTRHLERGEVDSLADLQGRLERSEPLDGLVLHGLDLRGIASWGASSMHETLFLGCQFSSTAQRIDAEARGAYVFPHLAGLDYNPYRTRLYTCQELLEGYDQGGYFATRDYAIYARFDQERSKSCGTSIRETLTQSLHDHAISDALDELVAERGAHTIVGIMGGHSTPRTDPWYARVARVAWMLTRRGYLVASGGGPGIMEAANLGAALASYASPEVIDAALAMLAPAPTYNNGVKDAQSPAFHAAVQQHIATARSVLDTFYGPQVTPDTITRYQREREHPCPSLAIPTWFYGHEPSNLFSDHIAKYFANSIREDGLLAISRAGVIFAPGSAGTLQEVFMDLAQNHYATFDRTRSPMIFLGEHAHRDTYTLLQRFISQRQGEPPYLDMLAMFDEPEQIVDFIERTPPRTVPKA